MDDSADQGDNDEYDPQLVSGDQKCPGGSIRVHSYL